MRSSCQGKRRSDTPTTPCHLSIPTEVVAAGKSWRMMEEEDDVTFHEPRKSPQSWSSKKIHTEVTQMPSWSNIRNLSSMVWRRSHFPYEYPIEKKSYSTAMLFTACGKKPAWYWSCIRMKTKSLNDHPQNDKCLRQASSGVLESYFPRRKGISNCTVMCQKAVRHIHQYRGTKPRHVPQFSCSIPRLSVKTGSSHDSKEQTQSDLDRAGSPRQWVKRDISQPTSFLLLETWPFFYNRHGWMTSSLWHYTVYQRTSKEQSISDYLRSNSSECGKPRVFSFLVLICPASHPWRFPFFWILTEWREAGRGKMQTSPSYSMVSSSGKQSWWAGKETIC
jgi:hypothetical protein